MSLYVVSMLMTVASNIGYHISQRAISSTVNPLLSLLVTYVVAMAATLIALSVFETSNGDTIVAQLKSVNWASYTLGLALVGLELGFLLVYRSGWKVSIAALFSNAFVTVLLIPVGIFFFHEQLGLKKILGIALASAGLWLLSTG